MGPPAPRAPRPRPPLALDDLEQQALLALNSERFADTAPAAVHATLLGEGAYLSHFCDLLFGFLLAGRAGGVGSGAFNA